MRPAPISDCIPTVLARDRMNGAFSAAASLPLVNAPIRSGVGE
jgi:hypothetical protein